MYLYYKREDGFVLIVAMVILLLLSVMGVAADWVGLSIGVQTWWRSLMTAAIK